MAMRTQTFSKLCAHNQHPYLQVVPSADFLYAWLTGRNSAIAVFATETDRLWTLGLGEDLDTLAARVEVNRESRWTVPRRSEHLLTGERSQWDWWAIDSDPLWPENRIDVVDLGVSHNEEISAFLNVASPTASTTPGSDEVVTWHGVRIANQLAAVGAAIRWKSGAPVLASIATHPGYRGQGLARAVTASLTQLFRNNGETRITLGMYAANQSARNTYAAVGYRVLQEFSSGEFNYSG